MTTPRNFVRVGLEKTVNRQRIAIIYGRFITTFSTYEYKFRIVFVQFPPPITTRGPLVVISCRRQWRRFCFPMKHRAVRDGRIRRRIDLLRPRPNDYKNALNASNSHFPLPTVTTHVYKKTHVLESVKIKKRCFLNIFLWFFFFIFFLSFSHFPA